MNHKSNADSFASLVLGFSWELMLKLKFLTHRTLATLKWNPLIQRHPTFFCTTTSQSHSFVVSYLINNCGFSQENALKASSKIRFSDPRKPDSVLSFFRNQGFSNSQIANILQRLPWVLSCSPQKVLLPKFQFLRSKGASSTNIVRIVTSAPYFLKRSLENHMIPAYEFVRGFLQTDKQVINFLIFNPYLLSDGRVAPNIKLLLDNGVTHSAIAKLLQSQSSIFCSSNLLNTVEELKKMGFDASTYIFCIALCAKMTVNKTKWGEKVDTFMRWGWSQEQVLVAFRRQPYCMLSSSDKINAVLSFWVEQAGFNSVDLVKAPGIFLLSLRKRIAPRASVLQYLISKGRLKKDARLTRPFLMTEKFFLENYVKRFKEDSSHLIKLYEEKMSLENDMDNTSM